jgi:hypothetical protein
MGSLSTHYQAGPIPLMQQIAWIALGAAIPTLYISRYIHPRTGHWHSFLTLLYVHASQ